MDAKEVSKYVASGIGLACIAAGALVPAAAALIPVGIGLVMAMLVPSTGLQGLTKRRDASGKTIPPGAAGLLLLFVLPHCGSRQPPPQKVLVCLVRMNERLAGRSDCQSIVQTIASVVSEDSECSELLLHGLKCEAGKDGG